MAGVLKVDTLNADSNLALKIANTAVAYLSSGGLTVVGNSLNVGGGQIVVTSNNSISTPTVIGANLVTVSGTTALGITANGQITTANAPFILTGGQLQFPATQIASADGNCLDDYEEGTFTPILYGSSASPTVTYSNQYGTYTKIGNLVTVSGVIYWSSQSGGSGSGAIGNLPFTIFNNSNHYPQGSVADYGGFAFATGYTQFGIEGSPNQTNAYFIQGGSSKNGATLSFASNIPSSGGFYFTMTYKVA